MLNDDFKGRECAGCGSCVHADHEKMKCFPKSAQEAADICRKKCFENSNDTVLSVAVMVKDWK